MTEKMDLISEICNENNTKFLLDTIHVVLHSRPKTA